ncbi:MAG: 50S ribosomal protein L11 methyltransferase [Oculatellaceae cyanobacterium bins.114]|nr:50S ribosomal protein L11 methyltransferase [Oculatellaceae cyanobacterium bins.114]
MGHVSFASTLTAIAITRASPNMSWTELSIHTTDEAVDWVSTLLASIDYAGETHITPYSPSASESPTQPENQPSWAFTIYLYLSSEYSPEEPALHLSAQAWEEAIQDAIFPLHRIGLVSLTHRLVLPEKPTDVKAVQRPSHRIGQHFVVSPEHPSTAHSPTVHPTDDIILKLGNSLAFGSGLHPATVLSLQLLEQYVTPAMHTLDLGSGTGILSVAMAKLGAQVLALDNDLVAVQATQDSIQRNQIDSQVTVFKGSLGAGSQLGHWMGGDLTADVPTFSPTHAFDLIVANILARIHISLATDFHKALRQTKPQGGILITAGFTTDYQDEVSQAFIQAGFEAIDSAQNNEWIALVHRLKTESP